MRLRFPDDGSVVDIDELSVPVGATLVLLGPNGSGKTTVLRLLAGVIDGGVARNVAYQPQIPYLFRGLTGWNLGIGLDAEGASRARHIADRLGVSGLLAQPAGLLSGGERHRVVLARTLASPGDSVLLDEPLAAIDGPDRLGVARVISEELQGRTAVVVTHDLTEAVALGDGLAVIVGGRLLQQGSVSEVLSHPATETVAAVVGVANVLPAVVTSSDGSLVVAECRGVTVTGLGSLESGVACRVMFGAESVALFARPDVAEGSARNRWRGRVSDITPRGRLLEVSVDAGVPIIAVITPGAADALDLLTGTEVVAEVKATAVRVVAAP